jgi:hypothetical protein
MNENVSTKARILMALFNASRTAPMAILTGQSRGPMSYEEAERVVLESGSRLYFDYLFGRVIKVDLNDLDFRLYDRDNGPGAGERAMLEELTRPDSK